MYELLVRNLLLCLISGLLSACAPQFITPAAQRVGAAIAYDQFISFDGMALPLKQWQPDGPVGAVVIALHGFNDYAHFIDPAARWWSARGIAVYAYDQRGFGATRNHGRWPGRQAFALDLQAFVAVIRQRHPLRPIYLLGESMGAAVVLTTLAETALQVDGVILSAPAVWGWQSMPLWQQWGLKLAAYTMPWQRFTGESLGIIASDNRAMLIALGRDPLVIKKTRVDTMYGLVNLMQAAAEVAHSLDTPALILRGEKDQVIPAAAVSAAFAPLPVGAQLRQYENGYHMLLRDLQAEVVWRDIMHWIQQRSAAVQPRGG
ncbi:MAG: alpha/beta hydrolase [Mariprofundus sp.]